MFDNDCFEWFSAYGAFENKGNSISPSNTVVMPVLYLYLPLRV